MNKNLDTFIIGSPDQRWFLVRLEPFTPTRKRAVLIDRYEEAREFYTLDTAIENLEYFESEFDEVRLFSAETEESRIEPKFPLGVLRVKRDVRLIPESKEVPCPATKRDHSASP